METHKSIALIIAGSMFLAFCIGNCQAYQDFHFNTYKCTVNCPDNAQSIQYLNDCYCKIYR